MMGKIELLNVDNFKFYELKKDGSEAVLRIKGIAINAGIHNGLEYKAEDLEKAHASLGGKQVRLDHSHSVKDVVGKVAKVEYLNTKISFEADIYDKEVERKIRLGLIDAFSVGVLTDIGVDKETKQEYAHNIDFKELSLVTDPADERARLVGVMNSKVKPLTDKLRTELEEKRMADETIKTMETELAALQAKVKELEEAIEAPAEPPEEEPKKEPITPPAEEPDKEAVEQMAKMNDKIKELEAKLVEFNKPDRKTTNLSDDKSQVELECGPLVITPEGKIFRQDDL